MKLLLWHCECIEYKDRRRSTRPEKLRETRRKRSSARFTDAVAAFTCVEQGDNHTYVNLAAHEILRTLEMIGRKRDVVMIPFAHLSSEIAQPEVATEIISDIIRSLKAAGVTVHEVSFGFHKDFSLHYRSYGHPGSVCFRSIPYKKR